MTTPSLSAVTQQIAALTTTSRKSTMDLRAYHQKAEQAATDLARSKELRRDAVASRQASLRATLGQKALDRLQDVHGLLHHTIPAAEAHALPSPSSDAGQAVRDRAVLEQLLQLEEGQMAERLRTDASMRQLVFSSSTPFELERVAKNPALDYPALRRQVMVEYAPLLTDRIDSAREAASEEVKAIARAAGSGLSGERVDLSGPMPDSARSATRIAERYQNLPREWSAEGDPMFGADREVLNGRMRDEESSV